MKWPLKSIFLWIPIFLFTAQPCSADSSLFDRMIQIENQSTEGVTVTTEVPTLEYVEIPLNLVEVHKGDGLNQEILQTLVDEEKQVYRWYFHPTDRKYKQKILERIKNEGIDTSLHLGAKAHLSVSRTLNKVQSRIDPDYFFALKTSTSHAAGPWPDRPQQIRSATSSLLMSDYLAHVQKYNPLKHVKVLPEPLLVTLPLANLAQNARVYDDLNSGNFQYFPLTAFYSSDAHSFSKSWLGDDVTFDEFMHETFVLVGKALAEIFLKTGVVPSSSHFQQFLLKQELNNPQNVQLVWRDHADSHLFGPIVQANGGQHLLNHTKEIKFSTRGIMRKKAQLLFSPLNAYSKSTLLTLEHPINRFYTEVEFRDNWEKSLFLGLQTEFQASVGYEISVKNSSYGPHIIFDIHPQQVKELACQAALNTLPEVKYNHHVTLPPED